MAEGLDGYRSWLKGDRNALEATVCAYNKKLVYYLGSLTRDYAAAEDLASETFLRLLLKKPVFKEEEQLAAWLYKTARNQATDHLRKSARELPQETLPESADEREVTDALFTKQRDKVLHETLGELNGDYRDVLTLLYFGELSYEQIGTVMKKNEKQVKNLAFRARQSLREKLERKGITYEE